MTYSISRLSGKVGLLPKEVGSLNRWVPVAPPETLMVLGSNGGMHVAPDADFPVIFGRNEPQVHVCVGAGDPHVSRRHGAIVREGRRWVLTNTGRLPIRLPDARLVLDGDWAELPLGYTPLFIVGPKEEHLLEVRIATPPTPPPDPATTHSASTVGQEAWELSPRERLVLACLAQRYLRGEPQPQPLSWAQVAEELNELHPTQRWTWRKAAHVVAKVRKRLSPHTLGLLEHEVPPPVGNALNHNLISQLLLNTTLTREDLRLLGEEPEPYPPIRPGSSRPCRPFAARAHRTADGRGDGSPCSTSGSRITAPTSTG